MLEQLINYLDELGILPLKKPVLLAVSGGKDSMVLCDLFLKLNIPFEIAHYNFQLRGDASDLDEKFVSSFAEDNRLVFHATKTNTAVYAKTKKIGIQEAARNLRYQWFETLLIERKLDFVATAHHKDDAAETMLFNFIRGGSFASLSGIASQRKNIIRPLMFATQEAIQNYAKTNQISYREDESNISVKYSRNRIRHQVIPELKKINPALVETMSRTAKIYEQGASIINQVINRELNQLVIVEKGIEKLPIQQVVESAYRNLLVWRWIKPLGFASKQVEEVLDLLHSTSGKKIASSTWIIFRDRKYLLAQPVDEPSLDQETFASMDELLLSTRFASRIIQVESVQFTQGNRTAFLDVSKIVFPVIIRKWANGDYFHPLGMRGKKQKVSDLLVQEKIPVPNKKKVEVLTINNQIAWVIGYRVSENFKIDAKTKEVLELTFLSPTP